MTTADLIKTRTPPISAELLEFGIGIFHAALAGSYPASIPVEGDERAFIAVKAVERELCGHGLPAEQESSLLFRVLAFPQLLRAALKDDQLREQVRALDGGYQISDGFLRAAARCKLTDTPGGGFEFDLRSLKQHLLN